MTVSVVKMTIATNSSIKENPRDIILIKKLSIKEIKGYKKAPERGLFPNGYFANETLAPKLNGVALAAV